MTVAISTDPVAAPPAAPRLSPDATGSDGPRLGRADVERLLRDRGPASRIETMGRLVADLEGGTLAPTERTLALEILRAFVVDAEAEVRTAVAWQIHNSPLLTEDIALTLARDIGRVAFPILRHADQLPDDLLLELVAAGDPEKQLAIAGRREVSQAVSAALVDMGNVVTVVHLLRNRGARVAEAALSRAMDRFGRLRTVADSMATRPDLPIAIVERLVAYVSEEVRRRLVDSHGIGPQLAARLVQRGREAATLRLFQPLLAERQDVDLLARHLHHQQRLTGHLLFRALCGGDLEFFLAGMAVRAGIQPANAKVLAWDDGALGLHSLMRAVALPLSLEPAFRVAVRVAKETGYDTGRIDRATFQTEVLDRLIEECGAIQDRELDELLLQVCDRPGVDAAETLLPLRA